MHAACHLALIGAISIATASSSMAARSPEAFARLAAVVRRELEQVDRVASEARQAFIDFSDGGEMPSLIELRGVGDGVHDFYTAIERVFEKVAPELDGGVPAGPSWHRELLDEMTLELPRIRPPVLRIETARSLDEFLRFRHLFRNLSGFELDWPRLRALFGRLPAVWREVRTDLEGFVAFLVEASGEVP